jgi:hypothetical protein
LTSNRHRAYSRSMFAANTLKRASKTTASAGRRLVRAR